MLPCQHPQMDAPPRMVVCPCLAPAAVEDSQQRAVGLHLVSMLALMDPKVAQEMDPRVEQPAQKAELESEQARSPEVHSVQVSPR